MRDTSPMLYQHLLVATIVGLWSFQAVAQQTKPAQRQDSVTVSAGISKEQLALENQLKAIVSQGDQALKNGNTAEAIRQYEAALKLAQNQPLLAEQRNRVMDKLATGYVVGDRAKDAIPIRSELLDGRKKECESESTAVSECAEAQSNLAIAKMGVGDFAGALTSFQQAEASYAKAEKFSGNHEFMMIEVKDRAETKLLSAIALFRLGKTTEAIASAEAAISELTRVEEDENINSGVRDDAEQYLQQAQSLRSRFKSSQ